MTTWDADVASYTSYELGEGPLWNPDRGILLWVDILGCRVHVGALDDGGGVHEHASFSLAQAPATLGAVAAPAFLDHERGTLVAPFPQRVGLASGFRLWSARPMERGGAVERVAAFLGA